ncbi:hypothetical protein P389DRAFT_79132 [Cystobasidium minutum MCA 4210]|uniref:uncharacterized protein n=1 Tax=Cystobasidium minutum MCA 4210 TaxID=1397322 RepID=UPI0034CD9155|eukprot:jgi/Rhomi1/79132/CE79131_675
MDEEGSLQHAGSSGSAGGGFVSATGEHQQQQQEYRDDHSQHQLHPLRTSLSMSDAGSSINNSLHASQRLQSTPRVSKTAAGHLHRVYRSSSRPVTVSSSVTPTEDSSISLSSSSVAGDDDVDGEEDERDAISNHNNNNNHSYHESSPAREYWNRIILDIENNEADLPASSMAPPPHASSSRQQYLTLTARNNFNNAPSSGSSTTLVERDDGSGNDKASRLIHPSTRTSPASNHASRFAAAVAYAAELEEDDSQRALSYSNTANSSSNRSLTPQPTSFHQHRHLQSSDISNATATTAQEGVSDAASRVHDIFRRHIHNASTSYTSRRSSANIAPQSSNTKTQRPRQRLRDLLAASVSENEVEESSVYTKARRTRRDEQAHTSHSSRQSRNTLRRESSSPISVHNVSQPQQHDQVRLTRPVSPRSLEANQESRSPRATQRLLPSGHVAHLSQEWHQLSRRSQNNDTPRRSSGAAAQSETEEGSVNDADVEDHQPEAQAARPLVSSSTAYKSPRPQRSSNEQSPALGTDDEDQEEEEEDDLSLLLRDVTPEEHEVQSAYSHRSVFQTPGHPRDSSSPFKQNSNQPLPTSPAITQRSPSPSVHTSPSPRRMLRQSHTLFQNQNVPSTPPKTPHLPGHYLSTTPFIRQTPATDLRRTSSLGDVSNVLQDDRSRLVGNSTLMLPSIPGGYTSPFPHPRQAQPAKTEAAAENVDTSRPAVQQKEERRKTDRFSSMLHRVIEEADEERKSMSGSPSRQAQLHTPESPYRNRHMNAAMPSSEQMSKGEPVENSGVSVQEAIAETSSGSLNAAEQTLQTLLVDLVKPLKGLVGGFSSPVPPVTSPDAALHDDSEATMVSNRSFEQRMSERKRKRSEQDAALRQLQEADMLDHSLVNKAEELKNTLEDMGSKFTTQVTCVLNETFARENRRRKLWFLFLILAELTLLWGFFSFANARAKLLYQTTYYDPFSPELYDLTPPSHIAALYTPALPSSGLAAPLDIHQGTSWQFSKTMSNLFRTSSNSFASFLPFGTSTIPDNDMSIISRQYTLPDAGLGVYVYQFIGMIRSIYHHLLGLGLEPSSFAHGTLEAGGRAASGTISQIYRVPT